jgi:hypothetical protein
VNVVKLAQRSPLPADTPAALRRLADAIEAGACTAFVAAAVVDGQYEFHRPSSLTDSVVLSSLLHDSCVRAFREGA